jgi:hypothetical protein
MAVGLAGGCANQSAPPGGPEDRRPPVVVRTDPDTYAVMLELDGRVRFHFDERISETVGTGDIQSAVTVSPMTGDVRVSHSGTAMSVSIDGGFRPGLVYRVTLQPVVSDLFGNRMAQAFEVVFSTGGDLAATATLAGEVWDRLSGRGVNGATVHALGTDSLVHVARTDEQGVFALRYLPVGDFVLTGFQDQDRDQEAGEREAQGAVLESLVSGDTVLVAISVLVPDTTPAMPGGVTALDSVTIVVQFDDFLDPASSSDQIGLRLTRDGGEAPLATRLFHEGAYTQYVDQIADSFARLDSMAIAAQAAAAADSLLDSLAAPSDSSLATSSDSSAISPPDSQVVASPGSIVGASAAELRPMPPRLSGPPVPAATPGRTLPGRRIVGVLDGPLQSGVEYQLRVTDVININGLPNGGGDVAVLYEPPAPDTVPPDRAGDPGGPADAGVTDSLAVTDTLGRRP